MPFIYTVFFFLFVRLLAPLLRLACTLHRRATIPTNASFLYLYFSSLCRFSFVLILDRGRADKMHRQRHTNADTHRAER